ncbi:hypothetical protein PMAYCL1PPCAC_27973, partial [Pristionchus mayeri]
SLVFTVLLTCFLMGLQFWKIFLKNHFRHDMSGYFTRSMKRKLEEDKKLTPFPLMALPSELIDRFLSKLSIEDRHNGSLTNKRMHGIALDWKNKYFVENLIIVEVSEQTKLERIAKRKKLPYHKYRHEQEILLVEGRSYSIEFFIKLSQNISIGKLTIMLDHRIDFHRDIYHLLKNFDTINTLILDSEFYELANSVITRSYLLELANNCTSLNTTPFGTIATPHMLTDFMHLYVAMMDGKTKLKCYMTGIIIDAWKYLLYMLGYHIMEDGSGYCININLRIFRIKNGPIRNRGVYLFDKNMEIFASGTPNSGFRLRMKVHETPELFSAAKSAVSARSSYFVYSSELL